jgi:hypothetical protein
VIESSFNARSHAVKSAVIGGHLASTLSPAHTRRVSRGAALLAILLESFQPLLPVALAIGLIALAALGLYLRAREVRALRAFAAAHHLTYSDGDPGGIIDPAFALFRQGVGRGCADGLTGVWQDLPVRAAHYTYYTESINPKTRKTTRTTFHFTVLLTSLGVIAPAITMTRLDWLGGILHDFGVHGIEFESEAFNRRFQVTCEDQAFAFKLIDPRMMEWLMGLGVACTLEFRSGTLLVAVNQDVAAAHLGSVFDVAPGFKNHVPRLVWREYGHPAPPIAAISATSGQPAGK